jgi:hypothetical protein
VDRNEATRVAAGLGRWSEPGVPHLGWECVGVDDLGNVADECEMCGTAIRYVHQMRHPNFPEELGVGCICAGHMEGDYHASRAREATLKSWLRRRRNWARRAGWRSSYVNPDNLVLRTQGCCITVMPSKYAAGTYGCRAAGQSQWGFRSVDAAKLWAFDVLYPRPGGRVATAACDN